MKICEAIYAPGVVNWATSSPDPYLFVQIPVFDQAKFGLQALCAKMSNPKSADAGKNSTYDVS
jgi:hypothetical protein